MKISGPSFSKPVAFAAILVAAAGIVAFNSPIRSFLTLSVSSPNREVLDEGILRTSVDLNNVHYRASDSCASCGASPTVTQQGPLNPTSATQTTTAGLLPWQNVTDIENGSNTGASISVLGGNSTYSQ